MTPRLINRHFANTVLRHLIPVVVFLALACGLWITDRYVTQTQTEVQLQKTRVIAEQAAIQLEEFFKNRFRVIHHMSQKWGELETYDQQKFEDEALIIQEMFKGFQATNWVRPDGIIEWVVPEMNNPNIKGNDVLSIAAAIPVFRSVAQTLEPHITPPIKLLQGFTGIVGYFPVTKEGRFDGVITAVFRTSIVIEEAALRTLGPQGVFRIKNGNQVVYQSVGTTDDTKFIIQQNFKVWDRTWTLSLAPHINSKSTTVGLNWVISVIALGLAAVLSGLLWLYLKRHQDLIRAKDDAEAANNAKSEFLANMSHELRTPLNSVIGFSEMINTETLGPLPEHYKEYSGLIMSSGRHLLETINHILDMSKIEAGEMKLDLVDVPMSDILNEVLLNMKGDVLRSGITIHNNTHETHLMRIDALRVKQILYNIIGNSLKFTEKGSITLSNQCGSHGHTLVIKDTGIGMTPQEIALAEKPFGQVDGQAYTRQTTGTGLGLNVTRKMMELHGGSMEIRSTPGHGTEVRLTFPPESGVDG
ncbi:MAG: ATP-binding protein [Magnetovibrio sp.]|nr:ATP-binding protein [Magnetovibrio sp.]